MCVFICIETNTINFHASPDQHLGKKKLSGLHGYDGLLLQKKWAARFFRRANHPPNKS